MPDIDPTKDDCLYEFEDRKVFVARMISEGYQVLVPEQNELFLDIDSDANYAIFERALSIFRRDFPTP